MKHLGDITKINGAEIEKVDCISFGSPCQDLSVAGKRAGLDGERSGLFVEAVRIIKEMREDDERNNGSDINVHPRWAIWENVSGAYSSNGGEDFRLVLELLARVKEADFTIPRCKKWSKAGVIYGNTFSIAWKMSDAQYYGVPQRRKRICVFCDFNGHEAGDILLTESIRTSSPTCGEPPIVDIGGECGREVQTIPKGLSGNLEPCIPSWKGIARDPQKSTGECCTLKVRGGVERDSNGKSAGKGALIQNDLSGTLGVSQDQTLFQVHSMETYHCTTNNDMGQTLKARDFKDPQVVGYAEEYP